MKIKDINELLKTVQYIDAKMAIYIEALRQISEAGDQHNPVDLRNTAKTALEQEPTTADEFNKESIDIVNETIKDTPEYKLGKELFDGNTEFNVPVITGDKDTDALLEDERINQDEGLKEQQKMLDNYRDTQDEIAQYDKKISEEAAESEWRGTVLHPNYDEEE